MARRRADWVRRVRWWVCGRWRREGAVGLRVVERELVVRRVEASSCHAWLNGRAIAAVSLKGAWVGQALGSLSKRRQCQDENSDTNAIVYRG